MCTRKQEQLTVMLKRIKIIIWIRNNRTLEDRKWNIK